MCINKNVVAGLAVVGLGIWWMAPEAIGAALPLLLIAICPLSMVFMMKAMNNMGGQQQGQSTGDVTSPGGSTVPPGQLVLPVAGEGAAKATTAATVGGSPESNGAPAEHVEDAPSAEPSALPVTANGSVETAPSR